MRVGITIDGGTSLTANLEVFPDVSSVTSVAAVTLVGFQIASCYADDPTYIIPLAKFTNLPHWGGVGGAGVPAQPKEGVIPRQYIDTCLGRFDPPSGNITLDFWRDKGSLIACGSNAATWTITIPTVANQESASGTPSGWWCIIDTKTTIRFGFEVRLALTAGVTVSVFGTGPILTSADSPISIANNSVPLPNLEDLNCMGWLLFKETATLNDWLLIPLWQTHGRALFAANGNFRWPAGVRSVRATGAAGGGGGGGGLTAGGCGGGGGGGAAAFAQAINTGVQATLYAVAIGAAGAGGAGGGAPAAGGVGGVTSLGALLVLAGGLGGAVGAAGPVGGLGGAAGGAGGTPGTAGVTNLLGGTGGGTLSNGIGGVMQNPAAASTPGVNGGGGGGGKDTQAGGAGGAGILLLEW
jgi:hypothetical protein